MSRYRVGLGYDVHPLTAGRRLILGGVEIPHDRGLFGHSDADVLIHAVCDALLGAAGDGDLGQHFSDRDPRYRDVSSLRLLEAVMVRISKKGLRPVNLDAAIVAQAPRLAEFLPGMKKTLAAALDLEEALVNVKATSPEGLGSLGRGEGIAAQAVCLLTAVSKRKTARSPRKAKKR